MIRTPHQGLQVCWTFVCLVGAVLVAQAHAQESSALEELRFMTGAWERHVPERGLTITEHWMQPLGGAMIGMGRTVIGEQMTSWESLRIVQTAKGIEYIAKPAENKEETRFKLTKLTANEVVFENPEHDFPQRIRYQRLDEDSLTARIEGTRNGRTRSMEIPFRRSVDSRLPTEGTADR